MAKSTMEDLREMMCDELDEIVKKDSLDNTQLEQVYKLVDIIKDIDEINMNGMSESGYSQTGMMPIWNTGNSYRNGYANNGYANRNRDSMGRYSRTGYSREGDNDHMIQKLERMMDEAPTEREREAIRRCLDSM